MDRGGTGGEGDGEEEVTLTAPFPWFGGKSTVAADVWSRLGNVVNYVEPFFGSGAVLLIRPHSGNTETFNDKDRHLANFWRASQKDPEAVAHHINWPVNECDLTARHMWLLREGASRIARCDGDPDYFDAQTAGWWCWGACSWIGSGWCAGAGPWSWDDERGRVAQASHTSGTLVWASTASFPTSGTLGGAPLPHLGDAGMGVNRQLPHLGDAGRGEYILSLISELSSRLRNVRVCCGDWERVCGPSVTHRHGLTGVFLGPAPTPTPAGRTERALRDR